MTTQQALERRHAETCPCPTPELHVARYGVLDVCPNCEGCPCLASEVPVSDPSAPQIPDEAVDAFGRAVCRAGWDVPAERAAHIDSIRAGLAAVWPVAERFWRDRIADEIAADEESIHSSGGSLDFTSGMHLAARIARGSR